MNEYYLSENIYLRDDKLYKNNKIIKKYDWHKKLNELGWTKLPLQLIKKLNTYSNIKYKNSQYGMLDCGQDGSCFFHCIAYALNTNEIYKDEPYVYNSHDLRNILANYITETLFNQIIEIYKILRENKVFLTKNNNFLLATRGVLKSLRGCEISIRKILHR